MLRAVPDDRGSVWTYPLHRPNETILRLLPVGIVGFCSRHPLGSTCDDRAASSQCILQLDSVLLERTRSGIWRVAVDMSSGGKQDASPGRVSFSTVDCPFQTGQIVVIVVDTFSRCEGRPAQVLGGISNAIAGRPPFVQRGAAKGTGQGKAARAAIFVWLGMTGEISATIGERMTCTLTIRSTEKTEEDRSFCC